MIASACVPWIDIVTFFQKAMLDAHIFLARKENPRPRLDAKTSLSQSLHMQLQHPVLGYFCHFIFTCVRGVLILVLRAG